MEQNGVLSKSSISHNQKFSNRKIKISNRDALVIKNIASKSGINIRFVENLVDEKTGKLLNASYDAPLRNVTVNVNGADPIVTSVVHESMHDLTVNNYENTVCVLTNEFDGDNNPIIVVFKYVEGIEEKNVPSHCVIEAGNYNMVASEYGKDDFYNHFRELISKDKILYVNKSRFEKFLNSKTLNLSTDNKVEFLESFNKSGFDKIIHPGENFVNKNSVQL